VLETYKVCYRDYKNKKVHLVGILRALIEKLKELEELRKAEVITEEEYQKLKEKLLPDNEAIRHEK
jgi:hypothetical protein